MMWTWLFLTPVYPGSRTNCEKGIYNQQPKSYTWILTPVIITPAGKKKWKYRFNPHWDSTIFHQSDLALDKRVKLNQGGQKMLSHIELRWLMRQDYSRSFESHHCILCLVFFKKREREKKGKKLGLKKVPWTHIMYNQNSLIPYCSVEQFSMVLKGSSPLSMEFVKFPLKP